MVYSIIFILLLCWGKSMEKTNISNKIRRPLRGMVLKILFPMLIIAIVFVGITTFVLAKYHSANRAYSEAYYGIAKVSASLDSFDRALSTYAKEGGVFYYNRLKESYVDLQYNIQHIVFIKGEFINEIRYEIGELSGHMELIEQSMDRLLDDPTQEQAVALYDGEFGNRLAYSHQLVSTIMQEQVAACAESVEMLKFGAYICYAAMIICLIAFVALIIVLAVLIRVRITKPIEDIEEWARMFRDDYCQMSALKYNGEDEIQGISDSFNIVRDIMREHQLKNEQLEEALEKIRTEEDNKKLFAQKLYKEKKERASIASAAQHDGLTGLYNRRTFDDFVNEFVNRRPGGKEGTLFLIDMDNFKNVNDTLGHLAGDEALITLAGAMRVVFPGGYLGRYGGDEFVAFIIDCYSETAMERFAGELCRKMNKQFTVDGNTVPISVSIGAACTVGVKETSELYMKADKALYHSKENGRNQYTLFSEEL